jgi:hypothetical protein
MGGNEFVGMLEDEYMDISQGRILYFQGMNGLIGGHEFVDVLGHDFAGIIQGQIM